nr:BRCA1-A complex subunit BRE [Tanacetum cinerariifolium]
MGRAFPVDLTGGEQVPREGHEELFGEDARPRPLGPDKARPLKKSKPETTTSTGESNLSNPFGEHMSTEFHLKREATESAYESSKRKKILGFKQSGVRVLPFFFVFLSHTLIAKESGDYFDNMPPIIYAQLNYLLTHSPFSIKVEQMWSGSKNTSLLDRFTLAIPFCLDYIKCCVSKGIYKERVTKSK